MWARSWILPIALIFMIGSIRFVHAVGFHTPPCEKEIDSKEDALKKLNRCLERAGRPPFRESDVIDPTSVCSDKISDFNVAVKNYLLCLKRVNAPLSPRASPSASPIPTEQSTFNYNFKSRFKTMKLV